MIRSSRFVIALLAAIPLAANARAALTPAEQKIRVTITVGITGMAASKLNIIAKSAGAHAPDERVNLNALQMQTERAALLLERLGHQAGAGFARKPASE